MSISHAFKAAVAGLLFATAGQVCAMVEMEEAELAGVTGTGIAIALEDIRLTASPTSFIELVGSAPAAAAGAQRGDLRWYGLSLSGSTGSASWSGACGAGILDMGCSIGGTVGLLAPHDNPILLRVFGYDRVNFQGVNEDRTVLELLWPTGHDPYRFSFWGELKVGNNNNDILQVQNVFNNIQQGGTKLRVFQHSDTNDQTLGLIYENHFESDVRFSVNQLLSSPDTYGQVPEFSDREGFYLNDYRIQLAAGQMHYQSLILDDVPSRDGNFVIEVTKFDQRPEIFDDFYGRTAADDPTLGYCLSASDDSGTTCNGASTVGARYYETHGYVRWGDWVANPIYSRLISTRADAVRETTTGECMSDRPGCGGISARNGYYDTTDGMFFVARPGGTFTPAAGGNYFDGGPGGTPTYTDSPRSAVNLGDSRIEGMTVHWLRIETLGAGS